MSEAPHPPGKAASTGKVLILGSSVTGGQASREAQAAARLGYPATVVTPEQWRAMTLEQFQAYRGILIGDGACERGLSAVQAAIDTRHVWGGAIDGNVVITGSDAANNGTPQIIENAVSYIVEQVDKTGMYISLGCAYQNAPPETPVPLLEPFGPFTVAGTGCFPDGGHIFLMQSAYYLTEGLFLNDEALAGDKGCVTRAVFSSYPQNTFAPVALALDGTGTLPEASPYLEYFEMHEGSPKVYTGTPYMVTRGSMAYSLGCGMGSAGWVCDQYVWGNGRPAEPGTPPEETCSFSCQNNWCGDGHVDAAQGEECDEGSLNGRAADASAPPGTCSSFCKRMPGATGVPPTALCRNLKLSVAQTCGVEGWVDNGSSDPDGDLVGCQQVPAGPYGPGTTDVTLTCTDSKGNTGSCSAAIMVLDQNKPVLTLVGGHENVECAQGSYSDQGATAADVCEGDLTGQIAVRGTVHLDVVGQYALTYDVKDASGNAANPVSRIVTVSDSIEPTVTVMGALAQQIECGSGPFNDPGATAHDACEGVVPALPSTTVDPGVPGVVTIAYSATDSSGNRATSPVARTVAVNDNEPPLLVLRGSATTALECGTPYADPGATANDMCFGNLTSSITKTGAINDKQVGAQVLTYEVSDSAGHRASPVTRRVTVDDTVAPVITLVGEANPVIACGAAYIDPGARATDACDGELTSHIVATRAQVPGQSRRFTITYSVKDLRGNVAPSVTRTVTLVGDSHLCPPEWIWRRGTLSAEQVSAAAASFGTVYLAGHSLGQMGEEPSAGGQDVFVARLSEEGAQKWLKRLGSASSDTAAGVAVDDRNSQDVSLYVTGYTGGALEGNANAGGQDVFLARYNAAGTRLWVRQWGTPAGDFAQAVATAPDGSIYVAGYTSAGLDGNAPSGGQDLFLVKYDAAGNRLWTRQRGSPKNDQAKGVAVAADGSVYVTGYTFGGLDGAANPSATTSDLFLVKYDAAGRWQWTRQRGTAGTEVAQAVATSRRVNGEVEVYVAGRTSGASGMGLDGNPLLGNYDIVLLKYDAAGQWKWTRQTGTPAEDSASAVTSDGGGNVYVTGSVPADLVTGAALDGNDLILLKYSAEGALLSRRQLGSAPGASSSDWGQAVAVDRGRAVYVAGYMEGELAGTVATGGKDAVVMKYLDGCETNTPGACFVGYGWGRPGWLLPAAGSYHSFALRGDGTVKAWGANSTGQLGDGTTVQRLSPGLVAGLSNVAALTGGDSHSLALSAEGTLYAWGLNSAGQLGDGTTTQRTAPVPVPGLSHVVASAGGRNHSLALLDDGTVRAWGQNTTGQLGDGTTTQRLSPVPVLALSNVKAVAAGRGHSLALMADGTVRAWGQNTYGQLGDGATTQRTTPVVVTGITQAVAIAAGEYFSLALMADGTVRAWGQNTYGQLGDGTTTQRLSPVEISSLADVMGLTAGYSHGLALLKDGTVRAWGLNTSGQLGNGTLDNSLVPVAVSGLTGATAIAGGLSHSLAVLADGTLRTWGYNYYGQLGNGISALWASPVETALPSGVAELSAGAWHSLALRGNGTVLAWGQNVRGQLGDGTVSPDRVAPVAVVGLSGVTEAVAGGDHSLALRQDGTVWAWGLNTSGQLGDGTPEAQRLVPVRVEGLSTVAAIAAGENHSLALMADGTVQAWGQNTYGQLGHGTTTDSRIPSAVLNLSGVIAVAAGQSHSLALLADGTVRAWGNNTAGQLGDGSRTHRNIPVAVSALSGVIAMEAGDTHSLALMADGTVRAWGQNTYGQLGDGTTTQRLTPVAVAGLSRVVSLGTGQYHSLALREDGVLWAWGRSNAGQLGDGTLTNRLSPVQVPGIANAVTFAGGAQHSLALQANGTVMGWGYNLFGQLGNTERGYEPHPVLIP
ncbi:DUF5011 domain-containing protein [Stigmatella sp. ncwal1]|uniref:DUF5011 domain-containing protein n=1 Tax=Stigmatella ashevillensis TaxID=2995309 RepID=A0ABT5DAW6_9BACT|nr:immunoglobulin-like domain-containing protein [Stigmatella ashevillena]MDC0710749.1 DUF5011 domain-containing protein [Stigmatella ashevillena]